MESVHVHEIFNLLKQNNLPFTSESASQVISNNFDAQQTFHSCSAENLTTSNVVEFLVEKGKVDNDGQSSEGCGCSH